jgi:hypothetical protein
VARCQQVTATHRGDLDRIYPNALICFSTMLICTAASSLASLSVPVDSAGSEKYRSAVVNLPYDFGKKTGENYGRRG